MRLFFYYALHTFFNQLRKLFKTWVLIFLLACMLIGGVIGFGASRISDMAEEQEGEPEAVETIDPGEEAEAAPGFLASQGLESGDLIELIAGVVILVIFVYEAISADKNGSRIFLPADVNLLFPSPMQPQSVLLFRLMTQLGTALIASIYLLFQLPNLVLNAGLDLWSALAVIGAWCFTIMLGKLLQLLLYTRASVSPWLKANLRRCVYALLVLVAGAYCLYWRGSGQGWLQAAAGFFNGRVSRFIPLWGWLKGFCMFAVEGNALGVLLCLAAIAAAIVLLVFVIWHGKADFYEDAMAKSEETAELLQRAQSEKGNSIVRRKKDRSESLRRDGLNRGWGARVYFFKTLYNRFRFAHLGFLTKTTETYLVAAAAVAVLCRFVLQRPGLTLVALVLSGLSFFRSLGNPLAQDTEMDYFVLIPESTWAKLFWSLMGGTANCLLDALPAMLLAALILWESPLLALAWIPFILSIDFYATNVGAFINLSVPVAAGKTIKQIVQIMFIYFGLLPDIAVLAIGWVTDRLAASALLAAALNLFLGFLFFLLSPLFLDPREGKKVAESAGAGDPEAARRQFSRLGMTALVILASTSLLQLALSWLAKNVFLSWQESSAALWLITFAPLYLVGLPLGLLLFRRIPAAPPEQRSMSPLRYLSLLPICVFLMYGGNLLGVLFTSLLSLLRPGNVANPLTAYVANASPALRILVMVVLAPLAEEYIFRRKMIDRMRVYGGKLAVVTSAVIFGAFHANFSQFFYAVALGLLFGYVYLKTGKLRYSLSLHMFVNLLGSVVAPLLLERAGASMEAAEAGEFASLFTPGMICFGIYLLAIFVLFLLGLVLLCIRSREVRFALEAQELPAGGRVKTAYGNTGMLLFLIACLVVMAAQLLR